MRTVSARAILAAGATGLVVYAFPGYMSYDSVLQLEQARSGELGDWHPPAMAALWRIVELVITGPLGMLLLQVGCFVIGVYLVLARVMPARRAALCAVAITWFPPIATALAVIWKDSQMIAYCMLGAALIVQPGRRARLCGLGMLALASAMRHNALTMTLPLLVLAYAAPRRRILTACIAWIAITAGAELANLALVRHADHPWQQSVAMMDLAGTARWAGLDDAALATALEGTPLRAGTELNARVRAGYHPHWMWDEIWNEHGLFRPADNDAQIAAIGRAWKTFVLDHPRAYLHARWDVFRPLLGLPGTWIGASVYAWFTDAQDPPGSAARIDHDASPSIAQHGLQMIARGVDRSWLFRPWLYAVAALVLLPLVRRDRLAVALLASALIGELALFVAVPSLDFRYSLWLVTTTLIAAAIAVVRPGSAWA